MLDSTGGSGRRGISSGSESGSGEEGEVGLFEGGNSFFEDFEVGGASGSGWACAWVLSGLVFVWSEVQFKMQDNSITN